MLCTTIVLFYQDRHVERTRFLYPSRLNSFVTNCCSSGPEENLYGCNSRRPGCISSCGFNRIEKVLGKDSLSLTNRKPSLQVLSEPSATGHRQVLLLLLLALSCDDRHKSIQAKILDSLAQSTPPSLVGERKIGLMVLAQGALQRASRVDCTDC